ncbi:hypothetical protein M0813_29047 [Anaeramoeba flamelloides]|uniref:Uncharacterized protein n=1 Tax=Anaeramoeba flamelloides TaxID=1746091 RepID=A0ABQ8XSY0_9EUKA|nr:hypothetical protein M0813_29047 [Anaeramoeba flamelloides]
MSNNEILSIRIPHKTKKARLIELLGNEGIRLPLKTPHKKVVRTFKKKQEEIKKQLKNMKPEIITIDSDSESEEEVVKKKITKKKEKKKPQKKKEIKKTKKTKKKKQTKPIIEEEIESEQEEEKEEEEEEKKEEKKEEEEEEEEKKEEEEEKERETSKKNIPIGSPKITQKKKNIKIESSGRLTNKKKKQKQKQKKKKTKEETQTNRKLNFERSPKKIINNNIFQENNSSKKKRNLDQLDDFSESETGSDLDENNVSLNATPTADNLHILKQRRTISKNKNNESVYKSPMKTSLNSADKTQKKGLRENSKETIELAFNVDEIKNRPEADVFPNIKNVNWDPNDEIEEGSNHLVNLDNSNQNYYLSQNEQEIVDEEESDEDEDDDDNEEEELQQTHVPNRVFIHQTTQNSSILDKILNTQFDPCIYSVFIIVIFLLLWFFVLPLILSWLKQL